jgi:hypothetical protein
MHPTLEKLLLSRRTRLVRAIINNDVAKMEALLDEGIDQDYPLDYTVGKASLSEPPVHIAVRAASNDCLQSLISRGARLNIVNSAREWPLPSWFALAHHFIKNQMPVPEEHLETARILLEGGAEFGTGGRHHAFAGTTPYAIVEQSPPLQALEKRLRSEVQARALSRNVEVATSQRPRSRL